MPITKTDHRRPTRHHDRQALSGPPAGLGGRVDVRRRRARLFRGPAHDVRAPERVGRYSGGPSGVPDRRDVPVLRRRLRDRVDRRVVLGVVLAAAVQSDGPRAGRTGRVPQIQRQQVCLDVSPGGSSGLERLPRRREHRDHGVRQSRRDADDVHGARGPRRRRAAVGDGRPGDGWLVETGKSASGGHHRLGRRLPRLGAVALLLPLAHAPRAVGAGRGAAVAVSARRPRHRRRRQARLEPQRRRRRPRRRRRRPPRRRRRRIIVVQVGDDGVGARRAAARRRRLLLRLRRRSGHRAGAAARGAVSARHVRVARSRARSPRRVIIIIDRRADLRSSPLLLVSWRPTDRPTD
mmetsp:Transcript_5615/g.23337  ORF Transcript_5615/g.23337 Transcript_5615/m.23337 type:complete len:350 (+) Transcript_5615:1-1050(+)